MIQPQPTPVPDGALVTEDSGALMVEAREVHKNYGPIEVLKGINLEVARGEVVCLIGPSGSGKSTLLRCVNHLERVDQGQLFVDGQLVGYRRQGDKLYELKPA